MYHSVQSCIVVDFSRTPCSLTTASCFSKNPAALFKRSRTVPKSLIFELGELQGAMAEIEKRGVRVIVIGIDPPSDTLPWGERRGLTMPFAMDPKHRIIEDMFHLRNPQQPTLPMHAIYLLDRQGKIYYGKVGRRRPYSKEFITAIDYHRGKLAKPAAP